MKVLLVKQIGAKELADLLWLDNANSKTPLRSLTSLRSLRYTIVDCVTTNHVKDQVRGNLHCLPQHEAIKVKCILNGMFDSDMTQTKKNLVIRTMMIMAIRNESVTVSDQGYLISL